MTPDVADWARKAKVTHKIQLKAAQEVTEGLVDANHRFGLYKKRVAINSGQGKRGGGRTLVAWNDGQRVVFLYGFKKNQQASVPRRALEPYREAARFFNKLSDEEMETTVKEGGLIKIKNG
ncbi:MAG: type II toxin-antitoxin system RelE/ParE family toxin [Halioglobus sp.]